MARTRRSTTAKNRDDLAKENVESYKVVESQDKLENSVNPRLDYSNPETFVTYGSAEHYYVASIENIYNQYPYDGSKNEKNLWHLTASGLDNFLFDNEYPRRNGHIAISHDGWGSPADSLDEFFLPTDKEYITIKGGPNTDNTAQNLASLFPSDNGKANIIDSSENQEANLTLGGGNTVEFWMKKDSFPHPHEVVLDVVATGSALSDRFCIYLTSSGDIGVKYKVGASDFDNTYAALGAMTDDTWHHYAISITATGTGSLYVDGKLSDEVKTGGTTTAQAETPLIASIGSYMSASAFDDTAFPTDTPGWCKLSASLDEFRFWKTSRTAEEIGLNYATQVYGGTNTDTANTDLGVYYKFNEGITGIASKDATVLDYSGRISNGTWTGYSAGARSLTSAMVESGKAKSEFKDPIIYSDNPDVAALKKSKQRTGLTYDQQNNASLYNSMPMWIREEDSATQNILKLTQIMSSYLDTLQGQVGEINKIKNLSYPSGSEQPYNFSRRNIQNLGFDTEDFFIDATVLEKFMDRNQQGDLEYKLNDIKNLIYQNIYNNLSFIMASKGTEKSFRNLARCFGIDENLLKLQVYSNNEEYKLEDKYQSAVIKKNMIDFNSPSRFEATMFQTSSANLPTQDYIEEDMVDYIKNLNGFTLETDIILPAKPPVTSEHYFSTPFVTSSVCGFKYTNGTDLNWLVGPDLSINIIREEENGTSAYFQLTSSYLGLNLTSSTYGDVYANTRWNLAAKLKNSNINTAAPGDYSIEFQGVSSDGNRIAHSFNISDSPPTLVAFVATAADRRIYAGAMRTDTTGSTVTKSDILLSGVRYWQKYLTADTIENHAIDATSYGIKDPNFQLFQGDQEDQSPMAIQTLTLDWGFQNVTSSDSSGDFFVPDISSGSLSTQELFGDIGNFHPAKGYGFPTDTTVINQEYVNTLVRVNPENSNGANMVKVLTPQEEVQQELSRPTNLVFSVEKSLYQIVSDEMLKYFSTSADLASLYFKAYDKYNNSNYQLELLRNEFFSKMENTPDVKRFYEYFKWIDDAVVNMLQQQLPASAELIDGPINVIEGHLLERNKLTYKTPTYATAKSPIYEGSLRTPSTEEIK